MKRAVLLIVEDDDLQYELYEEALSDHELIRCTTGSAALKYAAEHQPQLIVLDHVLEDGEHGLDFLGDLKELLPHVPVVVVSGALEVHQQFEALQGPRRAHYCLTKPVDLNELAFTVQTALEECGAAEVVRQFEALERSRRVDAEDLFSRSTDRLLRQNAILKEVARSRTRPNISGLARKFNVARRTIIRDLQELIRRGDLAAEVYPKWESPPGQDLDEEPDPNPDPDA